MEQQMSDEPPFEYRKWVHEEKQRIAQRAHDRLNTVVDRFGDATVASGQAALRAALVINGGAAAAMLAFIGSIASVERLDGAQLGGMAASLIWFAWGVAAAVVGMGLTYLANYFGGAYLDSSKRTWEHPYLEDGVHTKRWGSAATSCQVSAIAAGIISVGLFITGMLDVEASIRLWST